MRTLIKTCTALCTAPLFLLTSCGTQHKDSTEEEPPPSIRAPISKSQDSTPLRTMVNITTTIEDNRSPATLNLLNSMHYNLVIEGCATGYSTTVNQNQSEFKVYKNDSHCLAKLVSFTIDGNSWQIANDDPFDTYAEGDTATFVSTADASERLLVLVKSQIPSPVIEGKPVIYVITGFKKGIDNDIGGVHIESRHELSVTNIPAPYFSIRQIRLENIRSGAGEFGITLECNDEIALLDGKPACNNQLLSSLKYRLVEDIYNSSLVYQQAMNIMQTNPIGTVDLDLEYFAPGKDGLANGGFTTSVGSKAMQGPRELHKHPNMIFVVGFNDSSFLYFNIDLNIINNF